MRADTGKKDKCIILKFEMLRTTLIKFLFLGAGGSGRGHISGERGLTWFMVER